MLLEMLVWANQKQGSAVELEFPQHRTVHGNHQRETPGIFAGICLQPSSFGTKKGVPRVSISLVGGFSQTLETHTIHV